MCDKTQLGNSFDCPYGFHVRKLSAILSTTTLDRVAKETTCTIFITILMCLVGCVGAQAKLRQARLSGQVTSCTRSQWESVSVPNIQGQVNVRMNSGDL